jgi:hypothetical protein
MAKMGRPTIFDKAGGRRVQGLIGHRGAIRFEEVRTSLAALHKSATGKDVIPSDGDVIDYLVKTWKGGHLK